VPLTTLGYVKNKLKSIRDCLELLVTETKRLTAKGIDYDLQSSADSLAAYSQNQEFVLKHRELLAQEEKPDGKPSLVDLFMDYTKCLSERAPAVKKDSVRVVLIGRWQIKPPLGTLYSAMVEGGKYTRQTRPVQQHLKFFNTSIVGLWRLPFFFIAIVFHIFIIFSIFITHLRRNEKS